MTFRPTPMVKVKGHGPQVKKRDLRHHLTGLQVSLKVKGHIGEGQRSHGSRLKVTRVKVRLKVKVQGHQVNNIISRLICQAYR